jgi:hypothetical protein
MGNRVSIAFKNRDQASVVLFHHWGGRDFVTLAQRYLEDLHEEIETCTNGSGPLERLEPSTVMVDFIRLVTTGEERIHQGLYLGRTPLEGDNSDNGHFEIDVATGKATQHPP